MIWVFLCWSILYTQRFFRWVVLCLNESLYCANCKAPFRQTVIRDVALIVILPNKSVICWIADLTAQGWTGYSWALTFWLMGSEFGSCMENLPPSHPSNFCSQHICLVHMGQHVRCSLSMPMWRGRGGEKRGSEGEARQMRGSLEEAPQLCSW